VPTAIFAGLPVRYVPPLRGLLGRESERFVGWSFKFSPTQAKLPILRPQDLDQIARITGPEDEVHVLAFSSDSQRSKVSDTFRQFFRFRWFRNEVLREIGPVDSTLFTEELGFVLKEEEAWAESVKPRNLKSPLLLPETSFQCNKSSLDMWRHAMSYGNLENVISAEVAIETFQRNHLRRIVFEGYSQHKWIDDGDRIFHDTGERHAIPPVPRMWKFSYHIEDGFHFDVTHLHRRRFLLRDSSGKSYVGLAGKHLNIDPHGFIRGS